MFVDTSVICALFSSLSVAHELFSLLFLSFFFLYRVGRPGSHLYSLGGKS